LFLFKDLATQDFIREGVSARELAYCPYSKFQVGAAVLCNDGTVFTGCNVENAAYGISICAERTAIVKAVSSGNKSYKAIIVSAENGDTFVSPCGTCRQFIAEFGLEIVVYLAKPDLSKVLITSAKDLLPLSFKF
jgi:cytidine deaminase